MTKRKLQKTKTKAIVRSRIRPTRLLFAVGFMLVAAPASWLMASAQSAPADAVITAGTATSATATSDRSSQTLVRGATSSSSKTTTSKTSQDSKTTQTSKAIKSTSNANTSVTSNATSNAGVSSSPSAAASTSDAAPPATNGLHDNIITTIFWAGEAADASNAYITNTMSAWDEKWQQHYGGYDDPGNRNGYLPAGFTPAENPFYFALPYNDYDDNGNRRPNANQCTAFSGVSSSGTSWCKNAWIKITKGGKTAYAQWQDVGPLSEDDSAYVFGTAKPKNTWGAKAGLDVSPAVRDYLGLQDVDTTSWSFVSAGSVPGGPWKNVVTTSGVYWE